MVDVIIPFCNRVSWLLQACRSLQAQTFPYWRALLINDHSDPIELAPVEQLCAEDIRFELLHLLSPKTAPGPWQARNFGIHASTAPLVAFLDADDLWHPRKLELQLPFHESNSWSLSVTSYHRFCSISHCLLETRCPPSSLTAKHLFRGNDIPLSTVIVDREILAECGGFRPEHHEDYGLWLRLFTALRPPRYFCNSEPLMAYRLHSDSISARRYRSVFAVHSLFCQYLPGQRKVLVALAVWSFGRATQLFFRLSLRLFRMQSEIEKLPEAYLVLLG